MPEQHEILSYLRKNPGWHLTNSVLEAFVRGERPRTTHRVDICRKLNALAMKEFVEVDRTRGTNQFRWRAI